MEKRYVGVDLHRNQFTVCVRLESGRTYLREWKLEALPQFMKKLRASDEVAVEATGNTRLFYDAVAPHVARVVVVATNQFRVIGTCPPSAVSNGKTTRYSTRRGSVTRS